MLLHGWAFPAVMLAPLAKALAHSRRVTLVDLPGYGETPWRSEAEDLRVLAASIAEVVPPAAARFLADGLPRGVLQLVPGAAHAPFIGREASFAGDIEAFLASHVRVGA